MGIRQYKPTTPGRRGASVSDFSDLTNGKQTVIGESDKADVSEVWLDPRTRKPQAFGVEYMTTEIEPLVPTVGQDIQRLTAALGPQFEVVSRTLDDTKWVVAVDDPITADVARQLHELPGVREVVPLSF